MTLWGGTLAYFIQAGLTSYEPIYSTNTHYISAIGSQWWVLSILGIHAILFEKNIFINKFKIFFAKNALIPFFLALFFLNSSEWRKSPLYPIRAVIEKDLADKEIRTFLAELPKEHGVLFTGTEWLCPLTVEKREHLLCELGGEYFLEKMPLNVIVFTKNELLNFYNKLPEKTKNSSNGKIISYILNDNLILNEINWKKILQKKQWKNKNEIVEYELWSNIKK